MCALINLKKSIFAFPTKLIAMRDAPSLGGSITTSLCVFACTIISFFVRDAIASFTVRGLFDFLNLTRFHTHTSNMPLDTVIYCARAIAVRANTRRHLAHSNGREFVHPRMHTRRLIVYIY